MQRDRADRVLGLVVEPPEDRPEAVLEGRREAGGVLPLLAHLERLEVEPLVRCASTSAWPRRENSTASPVDPLDAARPRATRCSRSRRFRNTAARSIGTAIQAPAERILAWPVTGLRLVGEVSPDASVTSSFSRSGQRRSRRRASAAGDQQDDQRADGELREREDVLLLGTDDLRSVLRGAPGRPSRARARSPRARRRWRRAARREAAGSMPSSASPPRAPARPRGRR